MISSDWDAIWNEPDNGQGLRLESYNQDRIAALITDCFPDGCDVVDLGCGDGELAEKLRAAGHNVLCVDFSEVALEKARAKGLRTLNADLESVDFTQWSPQSFDAVVVSHVVDHLEEPQGVLKLAYGLLKEGGFLAIANLRADVRQKSWDRERYPTRRALYDESLLNILQSTVKGKVRLERHSNDRLALCFYGEPPLPTLSLCIIAWNEGQFLEKCLKSVPYDELIIGVDDASNDSLDGTLVTDVRESATYKVSEKFVEEAGNNSSIYVFDHMDVDAGTYDFSSRRNIGFELATQKFILQIDAHEYLNREALENLKKEIQWAGEREVFHIVMHRSGQSYHVPHVWRNNGKYHYKNAVHNILTYTDGADVPISRRVLLRNIHCYHEWTKDKADERAEQRNKGNIPGLLKEAEENPDSERPWFFIGNAYLGLDEFDKALEAYDECLKRAGDRQQELTYQVRLLQGKILNSLGRPEEAREKLLGLLGVVPERSEHFVYVGDTYAVQNEFEKAKRFYLMATHFQVPDSCMFVEDDLYGWWLYERLYLMYRELEDYGNAEMMLRKCVEDMPRLTYLEKREEIVGRFGELAQMQDRKVA